MQNVWSHSVRVTCTSTCWSCGQPRSELCAVGMLLQVCSAAHAEGEELQDTPTSSGIQLSVLSRYVCIVHVPTTVMA